MECVMAASPTVGTGRSDIGSENHFHVFIRIFQVLGQKCVVMFSNVYFLRFYICNFNGNITK
jgi:hypothetical protein